MEIAARPAWDYSETFTNRTTARSFTRVKADTGPSLWNRAEIHHEFLYLRRAAIEQMSDGLTMRLQALQAKGDSVVYARPVTRPKTRQELRQARFRASQELQRTEELESQEEISKMFWEKTADGLPDDINAPWRRPDNGSFSWKLSEDV